MVTMKQVVRESYNGLACQHDDLRAIGVSQHFRRGGLLWRRTAINAGNSASLLVAKSVGGSKMKPGNYGLVMYFSPPPVNNMARSIRPCIRVSCYGARSPTNGLAMTGATEALSILSQLPQLAGRRHHQQATQ